MGLDQTLIILRRVWPPRKNAFNRILNQVDQELIALSLRRRRCASHLLSKILGDNISYNGRNGAS